MEENTEEDKDEQEDLSTLLQTNEESFESEEDVVKVYKLLRKQAKREKKQMELLKQQLKEFSEEIEKFKTKQHIDALALDTGRPRTQSTEGGKLNSAVNRNPEYQKEKSRPHLVGSGELILPTLSSVKDITESPSPSSQRKKLTSTLSLNTSLAQRPLSRQRYISVHCDTSGHSLRFNLWGLPH